MMRPLLALMLLAGCSRTVPDAKPDPVAVQTTAPTAALKVGTDPGGVGQGTPLKARAGNELGIFAAGCFWGVEDMFRQMPGVVATAVGYTGGNKDNPSYEDVCSHTTGHAEAVVVEFDPKVTSYEKLLDLFFNNHDPTSLNRQGPDVGSQYRSAVFTLSDAQSTAVRAAIVKHEARLGKKIVTQLAKADRFWKAEDYHQQYDEKHGTKSCPIGLPKGT